MRMKIGTKILAGVMTIVLATGLIVFANADTAKTGSSAEKSAVDSATINAEIIEKENEMVAAAPTNKSTTKKATKSKGTLTGKTGPNGWPIIEYNESIANGTGPGLAWVKGVDYFANESYLDGSYDGVVAFTASNGITIKAILLHTPDGLPLYWPISCDARGKDLEPNSPYLVAVKEAQEPYNGKEDLSANVKGSLPNTSSKRTSINPADPSVVAYKQAYDYKRATMRGGTYYQPNASNVINDSLFFFVDGVGEYDKKGNPLWEFRNTGSCWVLTIYQNPAEYQWSGIKEVIEYLSPDGAALYASIYDDFYFASYDNPIEDFNHWYKVGSSQIYQPSADVTGGFVQYWFN